MHAGCVHVLTEVVVGLSIHLLRSLINGCFSLVAFAKMSLDEKWNLKALHLKTDY